METFVVFATTQDDIKRIGTRKQEQFLYLWNPRFELVRHVELISIAVTVIYRCGAVEAGSTPTVRLVFSSRHEAESMVYMVHCQGYCVGFSGISGRQLAHVKLAVDFKRTVNYIFWDMSLQKRIDYMLFWCAPERREPKFKIADEKLWELFRGFHLHKEMSIEWTGGDTAGWKTLIDEQAQLIRRAAQNMTTAEDEIDEFEEEALGSFDDQNHIDALSLWALKDEEKDSNNGIAQSTDHIHTVRIELDSFGFNKANTENL
ncbi:hypothetical protein BGZ59_007753 [Podila verticillata]|nr:hypothetical protein BGZ59_007753 [Podila verticillata]